MRSLHVPLLLAALSTGPVSAATPPTPAASRVVLPVSVSLAGVQAAAEARVPAERLYAGESACPLLRPVN